MRRKVVVTGGAGFAGSHLVEALLERFDVIVLDNFSSGRLSNLSGVEGRRGLRIVRGDIRDAGMAARVLKGASVVFHMAASVSVPGSVKNPQLTNDVNVAGTLNLLRSAVKNRVGRFIYSSSCAVYGDQGTAQNGMRPLPLSPYAVSKLSAENYCRAFYTTYGLGTVV